jgi:hypothetical protein
MSLHIDIGFFENFKEADTLLVSGANEALHQLLKALDSLAAGDTESLLVSSLPFVRAHNIALVAVRSEVDHGIRRTGTSFSWQRSAAAWKQVREQVVELLQSNQAHQILDGPNDEVTLLLSVGEYNSSFWRRDA